MPYNCGARGETMTERGIIVKRNRELGAILEASKVLTSSFDLEENLTKVMETLSG